MVTTMVGLAHDFRRDRRLLCPQLSGRGSGGDAFLRDLRQPRRRHPACWSLSAAWRQASPTSKAHPPSGSQGSAAPPSRRRRCFAASTGFRRTTSPGGTRDWVDPRIGKLTVYDVAHRVGAFLGQGPYPCLPARWHPNRCRRPRLAGKNNRSRGIAGGIRVLVGCRDRRLPLHLQRPFACPWAVTSARPPGWGIRDKNLLSRVSCGSGRALLVGHILRFGLARRCRPSLAS